MKLHILVLFAIVAGLIFLNSCRDEEIVTTSWNNIVICNSAGYDIPDLFPVEIKCILPSGFIYNVKAYFQKDENGNYLLKDPFVLPTDKSLEIIDILIDLHGWKLYARTPTASSYYFSSDDESIVLNISCGFVHTSYVNVDSVTTEKLFYTFKVVDMGFDSVRAYCVRIKTHDYVFVKEVL